MVAAFVEATAEFAGESLNMSARERLVDEIVPSPHARQQHAFANPTYRDYVRSSLPKRPIVIDEIDDATSRLGLGWEARRRDDGPWIRGKSECIEFLNRLVRILEDKLVTTLCDFDRRAMIGMILRNHEAAAIDRDHWRRTAAANLALHDDKASARDVVARRDFKLSAVFQTSRVLIEFAVCECPLAGGRRPGALDLSQLMTIASEIFNIGGWSDAIRWDLMEPRLRITPLGDVHANLQFIDNIVEPFSLAAADSRLDEAVKDYPKNVEQPDPPALDAAEFEPEFSTAFEEQLGASFDQMRIFVEFVEDLGVRADRAVLTLPRSSLLQPKTDLGELSEEVACRLVDNLSLKTRPDWRATPANYDDRDRHPWRFRRRLTVLRKPLIQIDDIVDPTILVAPGIVREAFAYMAANYHAGNFPDYQLSPAMRLWAGRAADRRGSRFASDVAKSLESLGWQTEVEIKITKLLGQGFARDYGDVDVLAWKPLSDRVLVIECKDVQFRKTYGEVAEQLSEFRGELRANGKPDYLMLHLNRMELLGNHLSAVGKYLKLSTPNIESHIIFRNPVPMTYALDRLRERVAVHLYDSLASI